MKKIKEPEKEIITQKKGKYNYTGNEQLPPSKGLQKGKFGFLHLTPEERKEIASRAGIQNGINRLKRRTMREWAKALGDEEITNKLGETMARSGIVVLQLYNKAMKGDTQAAKFLADLLGEMLQLLPTIDQNIILKID